MSRHPIGVAVAAAAVAAAAVLMAADPPPRIRSVLQRRLGFGRVDWVGLEQGRAVAKSLRVGDRREIAAGGAVRIAVPAGFFVQRFVDIVSFKQSPIVRQIGKFSDVPRLEDLSRLTFDGGDLEELESCRIGDCDLQLSAEQIRRVREAVDWGRPDARVRSNQVMRELLLEYVEAYRRGGSGSLLEYANDRTSLRLGEELRTLVDHSSQVLDGLPGLGELVLGSTGHSPPTGEFLYWSKEQFGLKPVVSITHVIIYSYAPGTVRADVPDIVIASKQIYASRYLAASLALTFGVDASVSGAPALYLAYVNRTRPRAFPPLIGAIVRRVAQGQTRDGLQEQLQLARARLEAAYRASAP